MAKVKLFHRQSKQAVEFSDKWSWWAFFFGPMATMFTGQYGLSFAWVVLWVVIVAVMGPFAILVAPVLILVYATMAPRFRYSQLLQNGWATKSQLNDEIWAEDERVRKLANAIALANRKSGLE